MMGNIDIKNKLKYLSTKQILLFGICCVERIIHFVNDYNKMLIDEGLKSATSDNFYNLCKLYISKLYINLSDSTILNKSEIDSITQTLTEITPDTEEISGTITILAQNAIIGLAYLFDFLNKTDIQFVVYCSDKVIESFDVMEENEDKLDIHIEKEYKLQLEYIFSIKAIKSFDESDLRELIKKNKLNELKFKGE